MRKYNLHEQTLFGLSSLSFTCWPASFSGLRLPRDTLNGFRCLKGSIEHKLPADTVTGLSTLGHRSLCSNFGVGQEYSRLDEESFASF
jgi:hypothetical protein